MYTHGIMACWNTLSCKWLCRWRGSGHQTTRLVIGILLRSARRRLSGERMRAARILSSGLNSVPIEAGQCQCTLMTLATHPPPRQQRATSSAKRALHCKNIKSQHSRVYTLSLYCSGYTPRRDIRIVYDMICILISNVFVIYIFLLSLSPEFDLESKNFVIFRHEALALDRRPPATQWTRNEGRKWTRSFGDGPPNWVRPRNPRVRQFLNYTFYLGQRRHTACTWL